MLLDVEDRETCLALLAKHASWVGLDIPGYGFMANPAHWVVVPLRKPAERTSAAIDVLGRRRGGDAKAVRL